MSVDATLSALKASFATIATPQALKKIYDDPREATSLGEFPCLILTLAPLVSHEWHVEAMAGLSRHAYTVGLYLFVGGRPTPLGELHSRVIPWPEQLHRAIVADIRLGGQVEQLGDGGSSRIWSYQIGEITWADGTYFGIKGLLPVQEKPVTPLG